MNISTTSASAENDFSCPGNSGDTRITFPKIITLNSPTKLYLNGFQNLGSAMDITLKNG